MSKVAAKKMPYGKGSCLLFVMRTDRPRIDAYVVRLGKSGLKVSKIILGTMQYGDPNWQGWVLPEEEAVNHIKTA